MKRNLFWGLALISGATLMLEISLTRLFSIVMLYHMSLVSVSMAMFGLTLGGLVVHWFPKYFVIDTLPKRCRSLSIWFGLSIVLSLVVSLEIPFQGHSPSNKIFMFVLWSAAIAFPPIVSGICICALLTRFPKMIGKLYAADLAGASAGCFAIVWILGHLDTPSAILLIAAFAFLAAFAFGQETSTRRENIKTLGLCLAVLILTLANSYFQPIRIKNFFGKNPISNLLRHEFWNAFSYVRVTQPFRGRFYWGAGILAPLQYTEKDSFLHASVDIQAGTPIMNFSGNWEEVNWLLYDVTNLVHHVRRDGPVLVIGSGGGRDVLSALIPSQGNRQVTGVDINPFMVSLLTQHEAEFFGGVANLPGITFVVDEARSWLTRSQQNFQVITVPMVDTFAASSSGAFSLTENSLYTVEAFRLFLHHLQDDGILSVSRWWVDGLVGESHRLVRLANQALREEGVAHPVQHLVLSQGAKVATLLIAKKPFSPEDLKHLEGIHMEYGFRPLLTPYVEVDPILSAAVDKTNFANQEAVLPLKLSAPTDNRPFFFQSYKFSQFFKKTQDKKKLGVASWDRESTLVLIALMLIVTFLAIAVVAIPFFIEARKSHMHFDKHHAFILLFFAMIGLGFMLFESAQLQRLNLFLGYPIYSLTVVLFSLLNSSAWGSYVAGRLLDKHGQRAIPFLLLGLCLALMATGLGSQPVTSSFSSWQTPWRIVVSMLLICPAGFFMGMLFPIGIRLSENQPEISLAWAWALNGIASTCAAIFAIGLSIAHGFSFTYWTAFVCYLLACLCVLLLARNKQLEIKTA